MLFKELEGIAHAIYAEDTAASRTEDQEPKRWEDLSALVQSLYLARAALYINKEDRRA